MPAPTTTQVKRSDSGQRLAIVLIAMASALILTHSVRAEAPAKIVIHLTTDWSHRHAIYSRPTSFPQAWSLQGEQRYRQQWLRQHAAELRRAHLNRLEREDDPDDGGPVGGPTAQGLHRDWSVSIGAGGFMAAGHYPAKFSFDINTTPSCTADYVAYTTSINGALSIVAFANLYSTQPAAGGTCNTAGPSVKWAYNTRIAGDTTGRTRTSPVLSSDGTMVAYVEGRTAGNGGSILQILKWKPGAGATVQGTIAAPATPDTTLAAGQNWTSNCPAANSCVRSIVFNGARQNTNSEPFYNYTNDTLYVGDNGGVLHKFTGVFLGTPAEVTSGGWPLTVNAGATLTGPVFDSTSGNIYVGDNSGQLSYVREVGSTVGTCAAGSPPCLGSGNAALGGSLVDPPIVDSTTGRVLVFDGTDTTNLGSVFQFDTALTAASQVTVNVGNSGTTPTSAMHVGAFDDAYFSAGPASGHLYVCGKDPAFRDRPGIYQLSFNASGVLSTAAGTPLVNLVSASGVACSALTEILNGTTDRIFFSVTNNANPGGTATGCTGGTGCIIQIDLPANWPPAATTAGLAQATGTSGIVMDNVGSGAQQSNIYFTRLGNSNCSGTGGVGCAVKLTQSGLQ